MTFNSIFSAIFLQTYIPESDFVILILIIGAIYIGIFFIRITGLFKKRNCPSCSGKLNRKQRTPLDKLLAIVTLKILPLRRYRCVRCGWEGLRWNDSRRPRDAY